MSDEKNKEFTLNFNKFAIFFIIGYGFRLLDMMYVYELLPITNNDVRSFLNDALLFLSVGIMFLPMWWKIIRGGFMAILQIPNYAVITTTTYTDGSVTKTSDHGEEAMVTGAFMKIIWFVVGYFLAAFATLAIIGFQIFTFAAKFKTVKNKMSYGITVVVAIAFVFIGPTIAKGLAPVFDPVHFNPLEITKAAESAQKYLYSSDFSFSFDKAEGKKENEIQKQSYDVHISYTKANDTTVMEITPTTSVISVKDKNQLLQQGERLYTQEFDRGKNIVPLGRYTFVGNVLTDYETIGDRPLSEAGKAEVARLLPTNIIFNRLIDDSKRLRISSLAHRGVVSRRGNTTDYTKRLNIGHPEGTDKTKRLSVDFEKTDDEYKLLNFWIEPYTIIGEISYN